MGRRAQGFRGEGPRGLCALRVSGAPARREGLVSGHVSPDGGPDRPSGHASRGRRLVRLRADDAPDLLPQAESRRFRRDRRLQSLGGREGGHRRVSSREPDRCPAGGGRHHRGVLAEARLTRATMRIVLCVHHRLDANAGAPGLTIELGAAYRALGHDVTFVSMDNLPARVPDLAAELTFPEIAAWLLARRSAGADIVDATTGDAWLWARLPFRGESPILVTRSHG